MWTPRRKYGPPSKHVRFRASYRYRMPDGWHRRQKTFEWKWQAEKWLRSARFRWSGYTCNEVEAGEWKKSTVYREKEIIAV